MTPILTVGSALGFSLICCGCCIDLSDTYHSLPAGLRPHAGAAVDVDVEWVLLAAVDDLDADVDVVRPQEILECAMETARVARERNEKTCG